jgi:hypothetical protein
MPTVILMKTKKMLGHIGTFFRKKLKLILMPLSISLRLIPPKFQKDLQN